jgi:hypothetical protein
MLIAQQSAVTALTQSISSQVSVVDALNLSIWFSLWSPRRAGQVTANLTAHYRVQGIARPTLLPSLMQP